MTGFMTPSSPRPFSLKYGEGECQPSPYSRERADRLNCRDRVRVSKVSWLILAICLLPFAMPIVVRADEASVLQQLKLLNQVPEEALNDKTDPGFSILRTLYDQDGPDFLILRTLLGKAEIRGPLNPSARCVLAGVISQRWDTFTLSGNLYLSGLQSKNPDLRDKARKKLPCFIQRPHIPELISMLQIPGPNVLAYDVL